MNKALVVYASTHGHTEKVAGRLAGALRAEQGEVDLREVTQVGESEPGRADVVEEGPVVLPIDEPEDE